MSVERRKFLKNGLIGLLSISLLPPSISFLRDKRQLSLKELFSRLSLKQGSFSSSYLNENFKLTVEEADQISRNGTVFYSDKIFCVKESCQYGHGLKSTIVSFYEKTSNGYNKVISLNHIELKAFANMISYLEQERNISDPVDLQRLLVPTFKSRKHLASGNRVEGMRASQHGYYTAHGYCSIQINAKGNRFKIQTKLLNFKKAETYQNSYEFQTFA